MEDAFQIGLRDLERAVVVDLQGKLIGSRALQFRDQLISLYQQGRKRVLVNLQGVCSLDSVGVMAFREALDLGLEIALVHVNSTCREILARHGLLDQIPIYLREEDAFQPPGGRGWEGPERRRHPRVSTNLPVEIEYRNQRLRGLLLNISEGGALLGYVDPLPAAPGGADEEIRFSLRLPLLGIIELRGIPVSARKAGEMEALGIRLIHSAQSQQVIRKLCEDSQNGSLPV